MTTPNQNSPEILCDEILADARRQSEDIIRRAQQEAEAFLARSAGEADQVRRERLDQARAECARRTELILAAVSVESARLRSARSEALLESVRAEVQRRLTTRDGFDYRETLVALAAEAIRQMQGSAFVVKLSAADRAALGNGLAEDIARRAGPSPPSIKISNDATMTDNGAIIEDSEGRQLWDNRLRQRLERLWPELRRQIAMQTGLVTESKPAGGAA